MYGREKNTIPMSVHRDQVCILIPTLNEALTVGQLVQEFRGLGFTRILVIDGNSTDRTREVAKEAGAEVVIQKGKGKGTAIVQAIALIKEPYVLMIDGDGTYSPADAENLLSPLDEGYDHVIGNRLVEGNKGAFSRLNLLGNQLINRLFKLAHSHFLYDILSGYRAFHRQSLEEMHLNETGFAIETEISVAIVGASQKVAVVPVRYGVRTGTVTKLSPFHDGFKIISTIYRLAKTNNPLFYFGLIGAILMVAGFLAGVYVFIEWLARIEHLPLTILTMLLIVVGFEIFMFGIISDMLLAYHREQIREIQELKKEFRLATGKEPR